MARHEIPVFPQRAGLNHRRLSRRNCRGWFERLVLEPLSDELIPGGGVEDFTSTARNWVAADTSIHS